MMKKLTFATSLVLGLAVTGFNPAAAQTIPSTVSGNDGVTYPTGSGTSDLRGDIDREERENNARLGIKGSIPSERPFPVNPQPAQQAPATSAPITDPSLLPGYQRLELEQAPVAPQAMPAPVQFDPHNQPETHPVPHAGTPDAAPYIGDSSPRIPMGMAP